MVIFSGAWVVLLKRKRRLSRVKKDGKRKKKTRRKN
jgi:hypothetical protein